MLNTCTTFFNTCDRITWDDAYLSYLLTMTMNTTENNTPCEEDPIISFSHLEHVSSNLTAVGSQTLVKSPWGPAGEHRELQLFSVWPQTPALLSGTATAFPSEMSVWQSALVTCDGWHNEWHSMQIIFTQWSFIQLQKPLHVSFPCRYRFSLSEKWSTCSLTQSKQWMQENSIINGIIIKRCQLQCLFSKRALTDKERGKKPECSSLVLDNFMHKWYAFLMNHF